MVCSPAANGAWAMRCKTFGVSLFTAMTDGTLLLLFAGGDAGALVSSNILLR